MLVEDSDDAELTFSEARVVHRLVRVANGKESINWLHARGRHEGRGSDELPALVLLDFKLRGMSGLEVLAEIRRHETTKRLPVAVSTTSVEEPS